MEVLYYLIPLSLILVALAVGVFFWAVKSGQYDDLEGPAHRILFDDEPSATRPTKAGEEAGKDRRQRAATLADKD